MHNIRGAEDRVIVNMLLETYEDNKLDEKVKFWIIKHWEGCFMGRAWILIRRGLIRMQSTAHSRKENVTSRPKLRPEERKLEDPVYRMNKNTCDHIAKFCSSVKFRISVISRDYFSFFMTKLLNSRWKRERNVVIKRKSLSRQILNQAVQSSRSRSWWKQIIRWQ